MVSSERETRGVQLIGTAHGNNLDNLMMNPTLSDLIGGIQTVTLGDDEARRRRTQKSVLERKAPPTFDVIVEIDRQGALLHEDVHRQHLVDMPRPAGQDRAPVIQQEDFLLSKQAIEDISRIFGKHGGYTLYIDERGLVGFFRDLPKQMLQLEEVCFWVFQKSAN